MSQAGPFAARWLDDVRAHAGRTQRAMLAAHALAPYMDDSTGVASVAQETMAADWRTKPRRLREGFRELEELGLLRVDPLRKKPNSDEWDVRTYRPLRSSRPKRVHSKVASKPRQAHSKRRAGPFEQAQTGPDTSNEYGAVRGSNGPTRRSDKLATCGSCGEPLGDNWVDCEECYAADDRGSR